MQCLQYSRNGSRRWPEGGTTISNGLQGKVYVSTCKCAIWASAFKTLSYTHIYALFFNHFWALCIKHPTKSMLKLNQLSFAQLGTRICQRRIEGRLCHFHPWKCRLFENWSWRLKINNCSLCPARITWKHVFFRSEWSSVRKSPEQSEQDMHRITLSLFQMSVHALAWQSSVNTIC